MSICHCYYLILVVVVVVVIVIVVNANFSLKALPPPATQHENEDYTDSICIKVTAIHSLTKMSSPILNIKVVHKYS